MTAVLSRTDAERIAEQTRAKIAYWISQGDPRLHESNLAQVAADVQAITDGYDDMGAGEGDGGVTLLHYASANLLRTASLYGVEA